LLNDEAVHHCGLFGGGVFDRVKPSACTSVRYEHACARAAVRLLRDDEVVPFAAKESAGVHRSSGAVAANRRHDRADSAPAACAAVRSFPAPGSHIYSEARGAFAAAPRALLHVSHLIHGR